MTSGSVKPLDVRRLDEEDQLVKLAELDLLRLPAHLLESDTAGYGRNQLFDASFSSDGRLLLLLSSRSVLLLDARQVSRLVDGPDRGDDGDGDGMRARRLVTPDDVLGRFSIAAQLGLGPERVTSCYSGAFAPAYPTPEFHGLVESEAHVLAFSANAGVATELVICAISGASDMPLDIVAETELAMEAGAEAESRRACEWLVIHRVNNHAEYIQCVHWHPTLPLVLTASGDNVVCVTNAVTGVVLRKITHHSSYVNACAWSPCGQFLATGGGDRRAFICAVEATRDTVDLTVQHELTEAGDSVRCVGFSPDSQYFCAGSLDSRARMYNTRTGSLIYETSRSSGQHGFGNAVDTAVWCGNPEWVVFGAWDMGLSLVRLNLSKQVADRTECSPPGPMAWDHFVKQAHKGWIRGCDIAPNRRVLAVAAEDHSVSFWRIPRRACYGDTIFPLLLAMKDTNSPVHEHLLQSAIYEPQVLTIIAAFTNGKEATYLKFDGGKEKAKATANAKGNAKE